jgi:hypothetical protein
MVVESPGSAGVPPASGRRAGGTPALPALKSLEAARSRLAALPKERLAKVWSETISELRGLEALRQKMAASLGFSPESLAAGLEVILDSVVGPDALALFEAPPSAAPGPLLIFLAATPPGLAAQALLPALALRRPALLKTSSAEPDFATLLVELLAAREPILGEAYAAATWRGGDRAIEAPLVATAGRVIAYGGSDAMADLAQRCSSFFGFGSKISLAIVGAEADPRDAALGLARDIALFDQRGCLSVQLVLTTGDAAALGQELATALALEAERLPLGPASLGALAEIRLLREEAALRGAWVAQLPLRQGTVIVEPPGAPPAPSPGWRTVRIHPLARLEDALPLLRPWQGLLQGAALAGGAEILGPALTALGVTRIAPPGELQRAGIAGWPNGGRPALEIFCD